jgi:hypothetical protein
MEVWQDASSRDQFQFEAIRTICAKHPNLLIFLFNSNKPEFRVPPDQLVYEARGFSSGQNVLIKLAVDIWSGCTVYSEINEILYSLDPDSFSNVILAMVKLRRQKLDFLDYVSF